MARPPTHEKAELQQSNTRLTPLLFVSLPPPLRVSQRNIELGRVCLVNLAVDPLYGKLVTIVDFVDMNRVRLDGMREKIGARRRENGSEERWRKP